MPVPPRPPVGQFDGGCVFIVLFRLDAHVDRFFASLAYSDEVDCRA